MNNKFSKSNGLTAFAIATFVFLVAQLIVAVPIAMTETGSVTFWAMTALLSVVIGATSFVCAKTFHVRYACATTVNAKPNLLHVLWGCAITVGLVAFMLPVNNWIFDFIVRCGLARPSVDLPLQFVPLVIVGCVIPAVCEELTFRGTIANGIIGGSSNKLLGCVASGALFALFHMNPAQTLHQFVLGTLLALLCYRSGSVWTSVIVHLFNNLLAVLLSFVMTDEFVMANQWWFFGCGLVAFAVCVWGYFATTSWQSDEQQDVADSTTDVSQNKVNLVFFVAVAACLFVWVSTLLVK